MQVVEGAARHIDNNGEMWTPVVIRVLDCSSTNEEKIQFLEDASFYKYGGHPNILSLIGTCLETIPLLLIQEYCQVWNKIPCNSLLQITFYITGRFEIIPQQNFNSNRSVFKSIYIDVVFSVNFSFKISSWVPTYTPVSYVYHLSSKFLEFLKICIILILYP